MKKLIIFTLFAFLFISFANAEISRLPPVKLDSCTILPQGCQSCTYQNITFIQMPDKSIISINDAMTNEGNGYFTYSFCNNSQLGTYIVNGMGDEPDFEKWNYQYDVTSNGREVPSSGIVILFIVLFLILIGSICYVSLYSLGHLMRLDFDMVDMAIDWGLFFMLCALFYFEGIYLGNGFIGDYMNIFILIGGILLVVIPVIAFVMSMMIGTMNKKKVQTIQPPRLWRRA